MFFRKILQKPPLIYNSSNIHFDLPNQFDQEETTKTYERDYQDGLKIAQEFIVGADLLRKRNQNILPALFFIKAAEQCIKTFIKVGIGLNQTAHNLDQLIRCAALYHIVYLIYSLEIVLRKRSYLSF